MSKAILCERANYSTGLYALLPLLQQGVMLFFFFNVLCNGILCVLFEENVLELKKKMLEKSLNQNFLKKSLPKYLLS